MTSPQGQAGGNDPLLGVHTGREIGGYLSVIPGLAGEFANSGVGFSLGFAFAVGEGAVRYHLAAGFMYVPFGETSTTGFGGFHVEPAKIGFPVMVYEGSVGIAVEPLLNFLSWTVGSADGWLMMWQAGVGAQVVLNYESLAVAVSPVNLEFRPFGAWDSGGEAAFGLNWPVRISAGARF